MVTHRIVAIGPAGIVTQGDAEPVVDPWVLQPDTPTMSRVEFVVPWVGWAYLFLFHPPVWALVLGSAIALVALTRWRIRPRVEGQGEDVVEGPRTVPAATPSDVQP